MENTVDVVVNTISDDAIEPEAKVVPKGDYELRYVLKNLFILRSLRKI